MKMKRTIQILTLVTAVALTSGCTREQMKDGAMTVKMTDAPGLYAEVNVEVESVMIHYADSADSTSSDGWVTLQTEAGIYNLLDLQNGVTALLADSVEIPVGKVNQMRLILGSNNSVTLIDSVTVVDLELSSQMNTGIKFNLNATIEPGLETEVVFDFDAEKSIVVQGNGTLRLKPVIKVVSVNQL